MTLLRLSDVRLERRGRPVLDRVSLVVRPGEIVGLLGPNGCGKTTLLRAALGLHPATGAIELGGVPLGQMTPRERARHAAYVPQEHEIAWPISVAALVALGRLPHRASAAEDAAAVEAALELMELRALAARPATELSGGERARALVARALAQGAPLVLADEPTAGLDPAHALALMATLRRLVGNGRGALVSLHDLGLAARWCNRVVLAGGGRIIAQGAPLDVLTPRRIAEIYGVEVFVAGDAGGPILQVLGPARGGREGRAVSRD